MARGHQWSRLTCSSLSVRRVSVVFAIALLMFVARLGSAQGSQEGALEGLTAQAPPPRTYALPFSATPPTPSAEQLARSQAHMEMRQARWMELVLPVSSDPVLGPAAGTETPGPGPAPLAPATFTTFLGRNLAPTTGSSNINEPAVAQSGKNVFYTGNWYAARSSDSGSTWSYVNPYADFATFCCDQDVVHDKGRRIILWYRQGVVPSGGTQNAFKLGVSGDGGASFCTYTTSPTNVSGSYSNREFDYPHIALSNNYLYITTNLFVTGGGFDRMVLLRWPLDALAACAGFSYAFWDTTSGFSWTPVEGATTQMYLGDHVNTSTFRVYRQPESSASLFFVDQAIPAWTLSQGNGVCPVLGGRNPCARSDQRILSGWVRSLGDGAEGQRQIGFFWNVAQGAGFPFPYVNSATFRESDRVYTGQPLIWNPDFAFHYASAAPNHRGDLGVGVFSFASTSNPSYVIGVDDDYNGAPPGWELYIAKNSTGVPGGDNWGDYIRVRLHDPVGVGWVATGYFRKLKPAGGSKSIPYFTIFGRERDANGILRSMNAP